ncbi:MAG TPA: YegS/Rv2252/BmrU family lipid kinase [Abditibacteriaceae bacterium]|nr:YegS/Rv2252/BmrU family lipid kinase [Abditibacteriaceae bacterium]
MSSHLPEPITLLINANSRKGRAQYQTALSALREAGVPLGETHILRSRDETERILRREIAAGAKTVIIGGGDGTLSACADHLARTPVAMAVLPLGTGNTFVRSLGIPLSLREAASTIADGHVEAVDVGRVNGQIFLNSVSLGLSAEIAGALDRRTKRRLGLLAWPVVGARVLWTHRAHVLKVMSSEKTFHVRTHQLVVVNGRYVAGPITAAPEASVQDHAFDVFVLGGAKHRSLARTTWAWIRGSHIHSSESRYFTTRALRIEAVRRPLKANVDGEINERTPLDLEVLPGALRVVVPRGFDAENA